MSVSQVRRQCRGVQFRFCTSAGMGARQATPPRTSAWVPRAAWTSRPTWPNSAPLGHVLRLPQAPAPHALAPAKPGIMANRQWATGARRLLPGRPHSPRLWPHLPGLLRLPCRRRTARRRQGQRRLWRAVAGKGPAAPHRSARPTASAGWVAPGSVQTPVRWNGLFIRHALTTARSLYWRRICESVI